MSSKPDAQKEVDQKVFNYFKLIENKLYQCQICTKFIKGSLYNLKSHISSCHKNVANELDLQPKSKKPKVDTSESLLTITLDIDPTLLKQGLVRFLVCKSLAFQAFEDEGFQQAFGGYLELTGISMSRYAVKNLILKAANELQMILKDMLEKKLLSLTYDGATRQGHSVFAVKAQFLDDNVLKNVSIGTILMSGSCNAENYKLEIESVLKKVGKSFDDVVSSTADTAAVMKRTAKLIRETQEHFYTFQCFLTDADDMNSDDEIDKSVVAEDEARFMSPGKVEVDEGTLLENVPCGAHVLQLSGHDVYKSLKPQLDEIRAFVKKCRQQKFRRLFTSESLPLPVLDNETRWDTKYKMCLSVSKLKTDIESMENAELKLSKEMWDFVASFVQTFEPVFNATVGLQAKNLTLSDLYLIWAIADIRVKKSQERGCSLAAELSASMGKRFNDIMDNDAMLCCLMFDPRFDCSGGTGSILSLEQKNRAINYAMKIHAKLLSHQGRSDPFEDDSSASVASHLDSSSNLSLLSQQEYDEVVLLQQRTGGESEHVSESTQSIKTKLHEVAFQTIRSIQNQIDVREYWYQRRFSNFDLYNISQVIFAVPPTSVEVERLFSALVLVYSHLRNRLSKESLNAVMLLRMNSELIEKLTFV